MLVPTEHHEDGSELQKKMCTYL